MTKNALIFFLSLLCIALAARSSAVADLEVTATAAVDGWARCQDVARRTIVVAKMCRDRLDVADREACARDCPCENPGGVCEGSP